MNIDLKSKIMEKYCESCAHVYDTCVNERGECTDVYSIEQSEYWD